MPSDQFERGLLFVTRKWPPAVGGMETYAVQLTKALGPHLPVQVVSLGGQLDGSPPDLPARIVFAVRAAATYFRLAQTPAILHIGDMARWPLALLAYARRPRPAVIMSAHGTDVSFHRRKGWKGWLYGAYMRLGSKLNRNATVIANSAATATAAAEIGWAGASVVPLATDFVGSDVTPLHDGQLLFAGRLVERKGCLWFVRNVLPLLPQSIGLKVAGPIWDEPEASALQDPRVTYLGSLDKDALIEAYRTSLCVVLPNIEPASGEFEGFGLVAVEASAVGGVVLASATGGLVEAVIDGVTGFSLPPENAEAWRAAIMDIAGWSNDVRLDFLEKSARRTKQVYSWQRVANDVSSIYRRTISARGRR